MKNDICTCSIRQSTDKGFINFTKGIDYDLDSMKFHADPEADKAVRDSLRVKYFKDKHIETNKTDKTGGKKK